MSKIGSIAKWTIYGLSFSVATGFSQTPDSLLNKLSEAEKKAGWILLFDGVDKDAHWRVGEKGTSNNWVVENKTLASPNLAKDLFSKEAFDNFEYSLEWKVNKAGNSGVFFRVNPDVGRFCSSSEYGILDDENGVDRTAMGHMPGQTSMPIKRTAANYDLYPTTKNGGNDSAYVGVAKPFGQWNQGVIWANGKFIEHWLNGQKVVDYELFTPDWIKRYQASKYYLAAQCAAYPDAWSRSEQGLLGMQDHGDSALVWFRNIKIRPFVPGSKLISPLMTPAGGKFTGPVQVKLDAAVTGAQIRYTLDGSDPTQTSPLYSGPITLNKNASLKARTYRERFLASDVMGGDFVLDGIVSVHSPALSPGLLPSKGSKMRKANGAVGAAMSTVLFPISE